jgi:hypothetical protein
MGGQGTSPKEQKTQQSPFLGFRISLQLGHSQKYWHEFSGIFSEISCLHLGQVIFE